MVATSTVTAGAKKARREVLLGTTAGQHAFDGLGKRDVVASIEKEAEVYIDEELVETPVAHDLFKRHLCPPCPAQVKLVKSVGKNNNGAVPHGCCPPRKTVVKTRKVTRLVSKVVTKTRTVTTTTFTPPVSVTFSGTAWVIPSPSKFSENSLLCDDFPSLFRSSYVVPGVPLANLPLVLMKISARAKSAQPGTQIAETTTDSNGDFSMTGEARVGDTVYLAKKAAPQVGLFQGTVGSGGAVPGSDQIVIVDGEATTTATQTATRTQTVATTSQTANVLPPTTTEPAATTTEWTRTATESTASLTTTCATTGMNYNGSSVPGVVAWWDSSAASSIVSSSSAVSSWTSLVSPFTVISQDTSLKQPTVLNTGGVQFDDLNSQALTANSSIPLTTGDDSFAMAVVFSCTSTSVVQSLLYQSGNAGVVEIFAGFALVNGKLYFAGQSDDADYSDLAACVPGQKHVGVMSINAPGSVGSMDGNSSTNAGPTAALDIGNAFVQMGLKTVWNDQPFGGVIFEAIISNSALATADRQMVEGYLAHKWNVTLVDGHPYKTCVPII